MQENYSVNRNSFYFWLHFHVKNAVDWIDAGLPIPHYLQHTSNGGAFIAWKIDGYFGTKRALEFLNDVIARVILTLRAERLAYRPYVEERKESAHIYNGPPVTLKQLAAGLDSLPSKWSAYVPKAESGKDRIFWAIKWKVEQMIADQGEGLPVSFDLLLQWAVTNFIDQAKDKSTLKSKCRSVWNWYDDIGWKTTNWRVNTMSRAEAAANAANAKVEQARKKIIDAMNSVLAETLKKKNGKWNAKKIAEVAGVSEKTVRKHLKEMIGV